MPSGNDERRSWGPPPDVAPDLDRFRSLILPALERESSRRAVPKSAGPPLDPARALDLLIRYGLLVHAQAEAQSLVAKNDRGHLFTRHLLDSLNPMSLFETPPSRALDVGSGAGFPGIPLAIVWPGTQFTLLESRERKAGFLERAVRELALSNVDVVCERLEDLGRSWRVEELDAVFVRAVAGLDAMLVRIAPAARPTGRWVYFLGGDSDAVSLQDAIEARGLTSEVTRGMFGGRLLIGPFVATP